MITISYIVLFMFLLIFVDIIAVDKFFRHIDHADFAEKKFTKLNSFLLNIKYDI